MSRLSVVVADDNEWMRRLVVRVLEPWFAVRSVEDGRELVNAVLLEEPDVVVSDVSMPGLGGVEALQTLRQMGYRTPFVMISADPSAGLRCLTAGSAEFVSKQDIAGELAGTVLAVCQWRVPPRAVAHAALAH